MKTGIYGGTFDPPHTGHIRAASAAVTMLGLDRLIVIPALIPPHKNLRKCSCTPEDRLRMTRLAFDGVPCAEVSDIEIRRGGVSFTADTVAALKKEYPDDDFYLLMGTDMFLSIESWHDFESIVKNVTFAVFPRREGDFERIDGFAAYMREKYGARAETLDCKVTDISSSGLCAMLEKRQGREFLAPEVYSYIIRNRAYGARPDFAWLREKAYAMLKEKRIPHVRGCEEEAARLAKRWGAPEDDAREAGILHDITKKETLESQLILCEKYGIINDNAEKESANLLHAKTGAAAAAAEFGMSEAVCSAIRWHTTGRAGMTLPEKIIYMADYIEPTRDFEGLAELRRLAYENLDAAVLLGLKMGLEDLRQRGIAPHRASVEAIGYFEKRIEK